MEHWPRFVSFCFKNSTSKSGYGIFWTKYSLKKNVLKFLNIEGVLIYKNLNKILHRTESFNVQNWWFRMWNPWITPNLTSHWLNNVYTHLKKMVNITTVSRLLTNIITFLSGQNGNIIFNSLLLSPVTVYLFFC